MAKNVISPEDGTELSRLYAEFEKAVQLAGAVLQTEGMESSAFFEADAKATEIWKQIRLILGANGSHWMA